MFTRSPKFIRISSNGLCDEVLKELPFTKIPTVFFIGDYTLHGSCTRIICHLHSCIRQNLGTGVNVGKGRAIFYFRKLLRFPQLFVGVTNKFLFTYPFLTCFLTFRFTSCIFLSSVRSQFFFCYRGFLLSFAWHGLLGIVFFLFLSYSPVHFVLLLICFPSIVHCEGFILIHRPGRISCY